MFFDVLFFQKIMEMHSITIYIKIWIQIMILDVQIFNSCKYVVLHDALYKFHIL